MPLSADFEPPKSPSLDTFSAWITTNSLTEASNSQDPDWLPNLEDDQPKPLSQNEMDYIVAKLG